MRKILSALLLVLPLVLSSPANAAPMTNDEVIKLVRGGLAGHQIEKSAKGQTSWDVSVRFDDGSVRVFTFNAPPPWGSGARVRLVNGALAPL